MIKINAHMRRFGEKQTTPKKSIVDSLNFLFVIAERKLNVMSTKSLLCIINTKPQNFEESVFIYLVQW